VRCKVAEAAENVNLEVASPAIISGTEDATAARASKKIRAGDGKAVDQIP
jgi:hypothetical protein